MISQLLFCLVGTWLWSLSTLGLRYRSIGSGAEMWWMHSEYHGPLYISSWSWSSGFFNYLCCSAQFHNLLRTGLKLLSKLIQLIIHRNMYINSRGVPTRPIENCAHIVSSRMIHHYPWRNGVTDSSSTSNKRIRQLSRQTLGAHHERTRFKVGEVEQQI
jgi:hypothetical protein